MENNVRALRSQLWFLICFMCKLPPQNTNDAREGKAKKIFSSSQFFTSSVFFKGLTLESVQIHQGWMNDLDVSKTWCIHCLVSCVCLFYLFFFDLAGVWIEVIGSLDLLLMLERSLILKNAARLVGRLFCILFFLVGVFACVSCGLYITLSCSWVVNNSVAPRVHFEGRTVRGNISAALHKMGEKGRSDEKGAAWLREKNKHIRAAVNTFFENKPR